MTAVLPVFGVTVMPETVGGPAVKVVKLYVVE
jgi:hypothetical protein